MSTDPADCFGASTATYCPVGRVVAVIRPRSVSQVEQTVRVLSLRRVPFHCRSGRSNWGYGSRTPRKPDSVLLSLEGLTEITVLDRGLGTVEVGAGVTFGSMREFVRSEMPAFAISGPASTASASVVGNLLDRGLGMGVDGQRITYLRSVRVVTPAHGSIDTGPGEPHDLCVGLGPDPTGIFVQSNLGVVTSARLQLHRPLRFSWRFAGFEQPEHLQRALGRTQWLLRRHDRMIVSFHRDLSRQDRGSRRDRPSLWTLGVSFETNSRAAALARYLEIVRCFGPSPLRSFAPNELEPDGINQIYPRHLDNERGMKDPDAASTGLIFANVAINFSQSRILDLIEDITKALDRARVTASISIRAFGPIDVRIVVALFFRRGDDDSEQRAMQVHQHVVSGGAERGYRQYRLTTLDQRPHTQLLDSLKALLDPEDLLN